MMLDAFFWKVFEETGDIDVYLGIREYRSQQEQYSGLLEIKDSDKQLEDHQMNGEERDEIQ